MVFCSMLFRQAVLWMTINIIKFKQRNRVAFLSHSNYFSKWRLDHLVNNYVICDCGLNVSLSAYGYLGTCQGLEVVGRWLMGWHAPHKLFIRDCCRTINLWPGIHGESSSCWGLPLLKNPAVTDVPQYWSLSSFMWLVLSADNGLIY